MKTLEQIAEENPLYYADMAVKANISNKILCVDDNDQLILIDTPQPELSYKELRLLKYPSIQEQLDMIYWDKINDTNLWQETIANIKSKYPKEQ